MIKRCLLFACQIVVIAVISVAVHAGSATLNVPVPNVLVIVADDLGVGDLRSFYPDSKTHTPTIDRLASQGMRFTRFYTESTCSASRAALLTGQLSARMGFHPVARGISPDVITMPDWFRQQGYSTHHIGKWHVGEVNFQAGPVYQGFDTSFGFMNQWFLQGPDPDGVPVLKAPVYENPWLQDEKGLWTSFSGYLPDILTADAVNKIEALAGDASPWFMLYASPLPHAPVHSPPTLANAATPTEDEQYQAMVSHLDKNIGQLVDALNRSGQMDRTIIIFLSDNGAPEKRQASNGLWAGGKGSYTEGGVRTPMIWKDPDSVLAFSLDERVISITDVFPTLAARIGKPLLHPVDGLDIAAENQIPALRQRSLYWLSRDGYSLLSADGEWRLSEQWMSGIKTGLRWEKIQDSGIEDKSAFRMLYSSQIKTLQNQFMSWLESASITRVVIQKQSATTTRITGSDFLRTPLKEWDFYIALMPSTDREGEQLIAGQDNVWSVSYLASSGKIRVLMHGGRWEIPVQLSGECSLLSLNADIYDRYTNLATDVHPSRLRVGINGDSLASLEWTIDSLRNVAADVPTWTGGSGAYSAGAAVKPWSGRLSAPVFFHRTSHIGEWPFPVDEKKLRTELCAQLAK